MTEKTCPHCRRGYTDDTKHGTATCCGRTPCWEQSYWTAEDWAECARLAQIALDAGTQIVIAGTDYVERTDRFSVRARTFARGPTELSTLQNLALERIRKAKR